MDNFNQLKNLFKSSELISQALTHRSWLNEHKNVRQSNERLEFLGDAVLEYVVSSELYKQFPQKEEGYLTALRANLVNTENLAALATKLNIGPGILLSKGEEDGGGRQNKSLLADTLEAIIGALYLDQGIGVVYQFIKKNLISEIPEKVTKPLKDAKSRLQEYVQSLSLPTPFYQVLDQSGPDHDKHFLIEVIVDGRSWGKGEGKSKSIAEQQAADSALKNHL